MSKKERRMTENALPLLRRGRNIGAFLGLTILFPVGIIPAFYLGCYGSLLLLARLSDGVVEPGIAVRIVVALGGLTGILCAAAMSIATGSVIGTALGYGISLLKGSRVRRERTQFETLRGGGRFPVRLSAESEAGICSRISFLAPYENGIHSVSVVGSAAYNMSERDSDIDVVIICKEDGYEGVRDSVCERELEESPGKGRERRIEYTVLSSARAETLFEMGSPFAFSIRYGAVLTDDGYLERLFKAPHPRQPTRKYCVKTLYENIAVQYFGSVLTLEKEKRRKGCSSACCASKNECEGLSPAGMFATVIMRMLYLTLPSRGYAPLTKADVLEFAREVYGEERAEGLRTVISLMRSETATIRYSAYCALKSFAAELFREVLGVAGAGRDVIGILRDAASITRGDFHGVRGESFKRCVL